jgi:serine/threonine protein kinase
VKAMQIRQIASNKTERARKRDELSSGDFSLDQVKVLSNEGNSSTVYLGTYNGKVVALKVSCDDDTLYQLKHERLLFESFSFREDKAYGAECIISYFGHITNLSGGVMKGGLYFPGYRFTLVTEFANRGSLETFIMGDSKNNIMPAKLTPLQTRAIVTDIAKGISALHDYKIVHCDIKLANMLITQIRYL